MSDHVELRMRCPVCGVRNHSVTFLADGPTTYHDCGHTTGDLLTAHDTVVLGVVKPPSQEMTVEEAHEAFDGTGSATTSAVGVVHPGSGLIDVRWRQEHEGSFPPPEACPECVQGKHGNCDGTAWDDKADAPTACPCEKRGHQ